jgi:hypothetical protein
MIQKVCSWNWTHNNKTWGYDDTQFARYRFSAEPAVSIFKEIIFVVKIKAVGFPTEPYIYIYIYKITHKTDSHRHENQRNTAQMHPWRVSRLENAKSHVMRISAISHRWIPEECRVMGRNLTSWESAQYGTDASLKSVASWVEITTGSYVARVEYCNAVPYIQRIWSFEIFSLV